MVTELKNVDIYNDSVEIHPHGNVQTHTDPSLLLYGDGEWEVNGRLLPQSDEHWCYCPGLHLGVLVEMIDFLEPLYLFRAIPIY